VRNISAWAIKHPVPPLVLFMVLVFVGAVSFHFLPVNLNPDVSFPGVEVFVNQPGAAPAELETQVLQKVEGAVASVTGVRDITSRSTEGVAFIFIEFQIGTPLDRAVNDVRDAVARVRSQLPEGILEPTVNRVDIDGGAIAYYAVSDPQMSSESLSWFVDNTITKRLLPIPGVAQVNRWGGDAREIRIELDPARMQALGITAVEVNQQLRTLNVDAPGGRAQLAGGEQSIRVLGGAHTARQLGETRIQLSGGRFARLDDIAEVKDGIEEQRTIARLNGEPSTTFNILRGRGYSDVTVLERVDAELTKLTQENAGVVIKKVFNTVEATKQQYHSAINALLEGSVLAVLVVWFFLRDMRATAISALAIPLSALPTFGFMSWMDFTLNGISLLALSLVAGVLVDDAIVEIENIVRHIRMGKKPYQAALDAADEIGLAVVATSGTIIAVFLPVSFMGGFSGQYFKQFGLTVAAAVFLSLLVARLITPVLAAFTLKPAGFKAHLEGPVMQRYLKLLQVAVRHRWMTIIGGGLFFLASLAVFALIPKDFIPPGDIGTSQVQVELPPGVRIEDTARVAAQVAAVVKQSPEVADVLEQIGSGDDGSIRNASVLVSLKPRAERKLTQREFEDQLAPKLRRIADARVNVGSGGFGDSPVGFYLTGDDLEVLDATARQVVLQMRGVKQLRDPRIRGDLPRPELLIRPRFDLAAQLGVSVAAISQTIRIATLGDIPQNAAKFSLSDRQVPIRVSLRESSRQDMTTLENLPVPTAAGGAVPLKAVADITFGEGPAAIRRYNQSRRVFIESDTQPNQALGDVMDKVHALPALKQLPKGVQLVEKGNVEFMAEMMRNFMLAIMAGILMVFAVLVLLFARVFQPITILSALPLSLGGALLALIVCGMPFSFPVVIGILMLMGIVAKNSILLVDFAIEEMRAGKDRMTALLEAGHKRAQPIVMTSIAMIAGMLPVALGIGQQDAFRAPMAISVIGGIITSTFLTLVIVPAVFTVIDDIEKWTAPKFRGLVTHEYHVLPHQAPPRPEAPGGGGLAPGRAQDASD
jgi:hydrophobe/amphiphile efflux-1 (HAE1) family protein